jgi:hypothetical protein
MTDWAGSSIPFILSTGFVSACTSGPIRFPSPTWAVSALAGLPDRLVVLTPEQGVTGPAQCAERMRPAGCVGSVVVGRVELGPMIFDLILLDGIRFDSHVASGKKSFYIGCKSFLTCFNIGPTVL